MRIKILIIGVLSVISTAGFAGNESGHGGGAYICENPAESELLDLFEASLKKPLGLGLTIKRTSEKVELQIANALKRIDVLVPHLSQLIRKKLKLALAKKVEIPSGTTVPFPKDTNHNIQKCKPAGVGIYDDQKNILIYDPRVLSSLPRTDQAAFWIHEAVYKALREKTREISEDQKTPIGVGKDSRAARSITGAAFSDTALPLFENQPTNEVYYCHVYSEWYRDVASSDGGEGVASEILDTTYISIINDKVVASRFYTFCAMEGGCFEISPLELTPITWVTYGNGEKSGSAEPILCTGSTDCTFSLFVKPKMRQARLESIESLALHCEPMGL